MLKKAKLEIKCLAEVKAIATASVVRPRSDPSVNKEKGNEPKV